MTKTIFCLEQTGLYSNYLTRELAKYSGNVAIETPARLKHLSRLTREKNDKIDSIRIAQYAYKNRDDIIFAEAKRSVIARLANLSSLRLRLIDTQKGLKTPLKEQI